MRTYIVNSALGPFETHRPPIDTTTPQTWGASIVELVRAVTAHGFGFCCDGSEYDLENFLADTWVGNMPWDEDGLKAVMAAMRAHPDFTAVMAAFEAEFGVDFMGNPDADY